MAFFGLIGNDREMSDHEYTGRESATEKAARLRREGHRRSIPAAARQGQAWEDSERARQDRKGRWGR
ncbi:hypothetical protein EYS09_07970 [Streptomyces kasugaensis]|uniref:Uncharacterized protein n=1 Tax=Streptomyces kasugaensis TaxID=1946 RepID=A0A4Q9HY57_STRKA|nr:hypothetical protein [Streptomyces kasugaensis]TBO60224.1 hypothetical protein EYS09_07970 [Streptomyces kasugaensis]